MTTFRKGADVEVLAKIAESIKAMQSELTEVETGAGQAMRSIQGNWGGDNLLGLVRHFNATAMPGLRACSHVFDDMGKKLDRNIAAQRSTSGQGGGSPRPGGGPGGGNTKNGPNDDPEGINKVDKGKGARHDVSLSREQDSSGDERNGYRHSTTGGAHTYDNTRTDDGSNWSRYQRDTHAGNERDLRVSHESGATYENERPFRQPDPDAAQNQPDSAGKRIAVNAPGAVNSTSKSAEESPGHAVTMYDANGNVTTDPNKSVRTSGGDTTFGHSQGYSEAGIKEGAAYAGVGGVAGAYLAKGAVSGDLGAHGRYDASGYVGAEAKGDAGVSLGKDGLKATATGEAFAGVKGEAGVGYDNGLLGGHASASAMAGAEAKAKASLGLGMDGVTASAGADAFAGVKAGAEVGGNVAGIGGTVLGEVYAGIGAHANVDANASFQSVKVKVDVGGAIGIGAGVKFAVDVNPKEFLDDVGLGDVTKKADTYLKNPFGSIRRLF